MQNANRALEAVKGELVFYLSSDDVFVSNKVLEHWAQFMLERSPCYALLTERVTVQNMTGF